jgi:hypothetical protein
LVNFLKGEYLEKLITTMMLINGYEFLTKIQFIEIICYKLNLFSDEDYLFNINNINNTNELFGIDNYILAENIVKDFFNQGIVVSSKEIFTIDEIKTLYESKILKNIFILINLFF